MVRSFAGINELTKCQHNERRNSMASKPTLARVAVVRGDLALLAFKDVVATNGSDLQTIRMAALALDCWHATVRAAYAAEALGDALKRGIEDPSYRDRLMAAYCSRIDELPDSVA
jgi:hypothetical protein